MRKKIIFFDDYPLEAENSLFLARMRRHLHHHNIQIVTIKTVRNLQDLLRRTRVDILILDIMVQVPPNFKSVAPPFHKVPSALAGVELLRRCRDGYFGRKNQSCKIFMRTTRGEAHIQKECLNLGADGYFLVDSGGNDLIAAMKRCLEEVTDAR